MVAMAVDSSQHHQHPSGQQTPQSLADLDDSVLVHILSWMPDPQPLAATCTSLHAASTSSICRQLWFQRWYPLHPTSSQRPLVLAALSWRGLPAATAPRMPRQEDSIACLVRFIASSVRHFHDDQQQQQMQVIQSTILQLPTKFDMAEIARAMHCTKQHLQVLKQLTPWPEHLLIPAAAAAGNHHLLQQLLSLPQGPATSACSSTGCSSGGTCTSSIPRLQHWLWQQEVQAEPGSRSKARVCWGHLLQHLPDYPGLKAVRHYVLQTALTAAARAGSVQCLQLLLGQLVDCCASTWDCAQALTGVAEVAAAGGHLKCLELVFAALMPPCTPCSPAVGSSRPHGQHSGTQCLQQQQGQGQNAGHQSGVAAANEQQQQQQQQFVDEVHRLVDAMGQWELQHPQQHPQNHQQQPANSLPEYSAAAAPPPALQLASSSTYLLIAAASSGCCEVVRAVMQSTQPHIQKRQLPAALAAAGQRGHVAALQLLLQHPELSSRPLQMAASDAALHGWPNSTLLPLMDALASGYRQQLLPLLAKGPLVQALQQRQQHVVDAMMDVLMEDAALDQADLLSEALLLLAHQGQTERVIWTITVAPTVLVKLGARAAAAALEGGHPRLAQLIMDRGGQRPAAFKAAAKRGQLAAAVAASDVAAVRELLQEVTLPLVWSCEAEPVGGQGGAVGVGPGSGAAAAVAGAARRQTQPTHCLLTLLKTAALSTAPGSAEVLKLLLLGGVPEADRQPGIGERQRILMALAKACFEAGRTEQMMLVARAADRSAGTRAEQDVLLGGFLRELRSQLQLPHGTMPRSQGQGQQQGSTAGPAGSSGGGSGGCSSSGALAAALALMEQPLCTDLVSSLLAQSYFAVCMPGEYLGSTPRPMQPAAHMPCLAAFTELLLRLARSPNLPPGARCRDLPLFRLLVRTVLQSCDLYLLHALLVFMKRHGEAVLADMPEDALRALRMEADAMAAVQRAQDDDQD